MSRATVYAFAISEIQIFIECPFCSKTYKKNGQPLKNPRRVIHFHGSCRDLSNRSEGRGSHCSDMNDGYYDIIIDDRTKRITRSESGWNNLHKILREHKKLLETSPNDEPSSSSL